MDVGNPYADVVPGPRGRVLVTLAQLEAPVTVRELARFSGVSPQAALGYVNELVRAGIVHDQRAGRALMVWLNRDHLAAQPIIELAELRRRLVERLGAELEGWPDLHAAWLFGSAARGDGHTDSDVDVLLVRDGELDDPGWSANTARLREQVRLWTGNEPELVELTAASLKHLADEGNPLIDELRSSAVPLIAAARAALRGAA